VNNRSLCFIGVCLLAQLASCSPSADEPKGNRVPTFSSDSAYAFIEKQVQFGPRTPSSVGHQRTLAWLISTFESYAGKGMVFEQRFQHRGYNNDTLTMSNILVSFNPSAKDRIMLCAHWDTRPRADMESDPTASERPILGADDGGSGVGVSLELARLFSESPPPIGVDIVLFDGEDYGKEGDLEQYFLGSRFWSLNPPVPGYQPRFGILLDMVGGKQATFYKEQFSVQADPALVDLVWELAAELNYASYFKPELGLAIQDDHIILNQYTGFRTINIINHKPQSPTSSFPEYWHTHRDSMEIIDRNTLDAVGKVLLELIYNRL